MTVYQRDTFGMSSSRNKENDPPSSSSRPRSSIPSLIKSPEKEEIFTNSYLGISDASQTSLIPSPQKPKAAVTKPRRKVVTNRAAGNREQPLKPKPSHRSSQSESNALHVNGRESTPQKSLNGRRKSPLPLDRVSTPPRAADALSLASPSSTVSSPPAALTDTYQRIEEEAELADTEGHISDPDDLPVDDESLSVSHKLSISRNLFPEAKQSSELSRGPTPTQERITNTKDYFVADRVEVMSDPTDMSFFAQMEDQNLAAKLTPMALESARDRAALRRQWSNQRPVAFSKAGRFDPTAFVPTISDPVTTHAPTRIVAFGKASKIRLPSELGRPTQHQRTFSDVTERLERPFIGSGDDIRDGEENRPQSSLSLPLNSRLRRSQYFSRTHGFPARQRYDGDNNVNRDALVDDYEHSRSDSPLTVSTTHSDPIDYHQSPIGVKRRSWLSHSKAKESPIHRPSIEAIEADEKENTSDSTSVDWARAAADIPLPSVEGSSLVRTKSSQSTPRNYQSSPEKQRRWENDFTGHSFQVSESPPVRNKSYEQDQRREREIQGVAKAAVTTSRLSQLRERESQESLRKSSRIPTPQPMSRTLSGSRSDLNGEPLPNSPVIIYRSSSSSSPNRQSETTDERPSNERSKSYDLLQRIARGSSTTPRSSPPPGTITKESISKALNDPTSQSKIPRVVLDPGTSKWGESEVRSSPTALPSHINMVEETPKVVGAWTDTILPDTIKTMRQPQRNLKYTQTPHVSAGGWIDTPFVPGVKEELPAVAEVSQEIPEELMNGIVKDSASEKTAISETIDRQESDGQKIDLPKSMAQMLLNEQKQKQESFSSKALIPQDNDTLNLGNATIQSLENLLDMDEAELTILSHLGDNTMQLDAVTSSNLTEAEVLERLGTKLDRLRQHIHDAKQGITKLEHQVSESQDTKSLTNSREAKPSLDNALEVSEKDGSHTVFPAASLTLSLPVPLLFYPRRKDLRQWLPRPTLLGWITILVWGWYVLECIMGELFSHPQYAESYVWPSEPEPKFPYVLPTMLWRWSQMEIFYPWILKPVSQIFVACFRMIEIWLGFTDGFADDGVASLLSTATKAAFKGTATAINGQNQDLNMMGDEFL